MPAAHDPAAITLTAPRTFSGTNHSTAATVGLSADPAVHEDDQEVAGTERHSFMSEGPGT